MVIYFSATGNSRYIAEAAADRLGDRAVCANDIIRRGKRGHFSGSRPWVFVFPVYINTMAHVFEDFLCQSEFRGSDKAYFIATCASDMGTAANACARVCRKNDLKFMGAEKIIMPQNLIAFFPTTKEEERRRRIEASAGAVAMICTAVSGGLRLNTKTAPAAGHDAVMAVVKLYNDYFINTKNFRAEESCTGCGVCEKVCPMSNIKLSDGKPEWGKNCVHCMACINRCPRKAIEYGSLSAKHDRYVCVKYKK